jgi:tight adherence protein B
MIPILTLQRKRTKRMRLFSEQLPDALDLIRAALQAGHSFTTAMYVVADEFPDPISEELRTVAEEVRLGLPLRDALYNLRDRVNDPNMPILIVGVLVAQEVGGNLAEVLDNTSYTIRERFKLLRDVQVMTAQGRLSGRVLTALPILVGLFLYFLNREYFQPMLDNQTGWYMLGYAVISIAIGHVLIQRIVDIRV